MTDEATKHNQAAYDQIAGLYAQRQEGRSRSFPDLRTAFAARLPQVADVADLGCGPAVDGALLAHAGHRVAGIDRSARMLAIAARALPGHVVQADLRCLPVAGDSPVGCQNSSIASDLVFYPRQSCSFVSCSGVTGTAARGRGPEPSGRAPETRIGLTAL